jgi:hypothetical protein
VKIVSLGLPLYGGEIFVPSGIISIMIGFLKMWLRIWETEGLRGFGMIRG